MRVVHSKIAEIHYLEILEQLSKRWTEREIRVFVSEYEAAINNIKNRLVTYSYYSKEHEIQYALIGNKQVKMYFKVYNDKKIIFVFDFFITRKDPNKLFKI